MTVESIEEKILRLLGEKEEVETAEMEEEYNSVIGAVKSLESFERVKSRPVQQEEVLLTEEGREIVENGSAEYILYSLLDTPLTEEEIFRRLKDERMKEKTDKEIVEFIKKGKNNGLRMRTMRINSGVLERNQKESIDTTRDCLVSLEHLQKDQISDLKKRKLITQRRTTHYILTKGENYSMKEGEASDITAEMIGSMDILNLKKYNFNIVSTPGKYSGAVHPLSLQREKVKKIFLQMGFEEMDAGKYVESSFWNFDALFQPQRHPARNEQDTFFMENPANGRDPEKSYLEKVRKVHTVGEYGSVGYQAPWSVDVSRMNVLRTHTTAVTTRVLYKIAQESIAHTGDVPFNYDRKYFSIDRVFRNESLDATHLAEFHQVEGIIMGKGLTISHLMGFMEEFFKQLGINRIKYKPAYNPYTEPSMEVFGYHEEMKKWMEIGNSGLFRPEMLLPMGYPEDVRVIGWGISLERPVMIERQINNIRNLVGHKVDMSFIRNGLYSSTGR